MSENVNVVNDTQAAIVEPQKDSEATLPTAAETAEKETAQNVGVADRPVQSKEENAKFAAMRRKYEQDVKAKEDILNEQTRLAKAAGFESVDKLIETFAADRAGVSVEEYREQQKTAEEKRKETVETSPEYLAMKEKLENMNADRIQQQMQHDLETIQKEYPEVKTLEDLGDVYSTLLTAGHSPIEAAKAAMALKAKAPAPIGAVGAQEKAPGEYYSDEEIEYYNSNPAEMDKLSSSNFQKLLNSLSKKRGK